MKTLINIAKVFSFLAGLFFLISALAVSETSKEMFWVLLFCTFSSFAAFLGFLLYPKNKK
jgi:hypothetical protein